MVKIKDNYLEPSEFPWPEEGGAWVLRLEWAAGAHGIECTGLALSLAEGQAVQPLTATLLRRVRLQDEIRRARSERARRHGAEFIEAYDEAAAGDSRNAHLLEEVSSGAAATTRRAVEAWSPPRRAGRPTQLDDEYYRAVARVYSEAAVRQQPPTKAVQTNFHVSGATASRYVSRARELGLLPEARRGQASANSDLIRTEGEVR